MNKIINALKRDWLILVLILGTFFVGMYFYPLLPEKVPSHWNIRGEVDGYSSRLFGAMGLPLINLGIYFLFAILPILDPKRKNYEGFTNSYKSMRIIFHVFFIWIYAITILKILRIRKKCSSYYRI